MLAILMYLFVHSGRCAPASPTPKPLATISVAMYKVRPVTSLLASLIFLLVAIACALGVVAAQHKARKLFSELQKEKDRAQQMEVEWGQLQLEQGTWAMPARVEKIATIKLQMLSPKGGQIQFVAIELAQGRPESGAQP